MSLIRHLVTDVDTSPHGLAWASQLGLRAVMASDDEATLRYASDCLSLHFPNAQQGDICVDFVGGALRYRVKHGGGFGQAVAKACGLSPKVMPTIIDMTAGLGRDAFVLASLGARVTLVERQPLVHALLSDGLRRAVESAEVSDIISRMLLLHSDSIHLDIGEYDVVYLDPMFPERKKSAAVKKEMAAFHQLVGTDDDADRLLDRALSAARYRVVVKRPKGAPFLNDCKPSQSLTGKSGRFDIYTKRSMAPGKFKSEVD